MTFLLSDGDRRPNIAEHFSMGNVCRYVMGVTHVRHKRKSGERNRISADNIARRRLTKIALKELPSCVYVTALTTCRITPVRDFGLS